ncbi:MAG: TusE/DsrC/DsvC family sulfur relay protein [Desulfuromonadales bacterium]|nr:TusE/DsrC/DsvC family sulfur relay protein [Desulfuromonadales bacterium]
MLNIEFQGKQIAFLDSGYIIKLNDWSEDLARHLAAEDGIILTEAHLEVIHFLRDYYRKYQIAPSIHILAREIGKVLGPEKGTTKYLHQLFPGGPAREACRYAGLPKPTGCV